MKDKQLRPGESPAQSKETVRASISFAPDVYETLEMIARKQKVSLAWVVRDAVDKYVADKWPLFLSQR